MNDTEITVDGLVAMGGVRESETRVRFGAELCFLEKGVWQLWTHQGLRFLWEVQAVLDNLNRKAVKK